MKTKLEIDVDYRPVVAADSMGTQYKCYGSNRTLVFTQEAPLPETLREAYNASQEITDHDNLTLWWNASETVFDLDVPKKLYFVTIGYAPIEVKYLGHRYSHAGSRKIGLMTTHTYYLTLSYTTTDAETVVGVNDQFSALHAAYAILIKGPYPEASITVKTEDGNTHTLNFNPWEKNNG